MPSLEKTREALDIFIKHCTDDRDALVVGDGYVFGPDQPPRGSEDGDRLEEIGWNWDEEVACWATF